MIKTGRFIVKRTLRNGGGHNFILKCALLLVCSLLSMALFSCAGGAGGSSGGSEATSLALKLPNTGAQRTLYEKDDIVSFTVTISSGTFTSTKTANRGETMLFSDLPAGVYSVKAYGKIANGSIAAKCETSVTIVAGETTTTTLRLQRLDWYTVTFKDDDEAHSVLSSAKVTTGYPVTVPSDPASTVGHTFSYWGTTANATTSFDFNTPITSDIDLYAVYNITKYTVTFDYNGGKLDDATSTTQQVAHGGTPTDVTHPTRVDSVKGTYEFLGWATDATATTATGISGTVTADKTFYAVWKPKYAITFDYKGGTDGTASSKVVYVDKDETIAMPTAPTKTGNMFMGWSINEEAASATYGSGFANLGTATSDYSYYAVWQTAYTVTYVSPAKEITEEEFPGKLTFTAETGLSSFPEPEVDGLRFGGWYTDADFTSVRQTGISANMPGDVTRYAKWEAHVTVDSSIAADYNDADQWILYNGTVTVPTVNYFPSSSTGGDRDLDPVGIWYKDDDIDSIVTGGYDFTTPVTSGFTLRLGQYVKVYCYYLAPGSTDYSSVTLIGGEAVKKKLNDSLSASDLPTPAAPDGYVLDGWDDVYIPTGPYAPTVIPYNSFGSQLDRGVKLYTRWRTAP